MSKEKWRPHPYLPGYSVSNLGNVRTDLTPHAGTVLSQQFTDDGYLRVQLTVNGKRFRRFVHQLVLETWVGPRPSSEHQSRHLNGVRSDNRSDNLAWGTAQENIDDRASHGTTTRGEAHYRAKLTEAQVREIRRLAHGAPYAALAKQFSVSDVLIGLIVRRKVWKHV